MVSENLNSSVRPCSTSLETLTKDATISQRDEINRAISENAAGVDALAKRILDDPEIHNPIACFLSKLRNGAHRTRQTRTDGLHERKNIEILFDGELAEANAARARALIQRLTGKPRLVEDDDIPGYGDAA